MLNYGLALKVLSKHWYIAPILAMAAFIGIQRWQVTNLSNNLEASKITIATLESRNEVTQKSLDEAMLHIAENNKRIEAGAKALIDQRVRSAASMAALAEQYGSTLNTVKALQEHSKKAIDHDPCVPSDIARKALEKL